MTLTEGYIAPDNSVRASEGVPASSLLDVLSEDNQNLDIPRDSLRSWLTTSTITLTERKLRESSVLSSVGLPDHAMSITERLALVDNQRRALLVGISDESLTAARSLLHAGVGVVLVDMYPTALQQSEKLSQADHERLLGDVLHHPLTISLNAHDPIDIEAAAGVFHGIFFSSQEQSVTEITGIWEKQRHVIHSDAVERAMSLEVATQGGIHADGRHIGTIALRHDGGMGKIYVVGDDPHATVEAAKKAVSLVIAHETARKSAEEARKKSHKDNPLSVKSAQKVVIRRGRAEVNDDMQSITVEERVSRASLPVRCLRTVVIAHPDGMRPFEAIGITREQLRSAGISVADGRQLTSIREAPLTQGLHADSTWHVTASQINALRQTEGIGAVMVAQTANRLEQASPVPIIGGKFGVSVDGKKTPVQDAKEAAQLFSALVSPKPTFGEYNISAAIATIAAELPVEFLDATRLVTERHEHLIRSSYEAISDALRLYAHTRIARITLHEAHTRKAKTIRRHAAYMLELASALEYESHTRTVEQSAIGIPDMIVHTRRYGAKKSDTQDIALGVRVLHDGGIQIQQKSGDWLPIGGRGAEQQLIAHVLRRVGLYHHTFDPNVRYSASIVGLRAVRHAHLVNSAGYEFSKEGNRGSVYHTPNGGIRMVFEGDASSHAHSVAISADGVLHTVGKEQVKVKRFDRSIHLKSVRDVLPFSLSAQTYSDVSRLHEQAVRSLVEYSLRALLSPYATELQMAGYQGDIGKRFTLQKFYTGTTDSLGDRETYYALSYTDHDGVAREIGLNVMENGDIWRYDDQIQTWEQVTTDAALHGHLIKTLSLRTGSVGTVPILTLLKESISGADELIRSSYMYTQTQKIQIPERKRAQVLDDSPIVFSASGRVYMQKRDPSGRDTYEPVLSDRSVRRYISNMRYRGDRQHTHMHAMHVRQFLRPQQ